MAAPVSGPVPRKYLSLSGATCSSSRSLEARGAGPPATRLCPTESEALGDSRPAGLQPPGPWAPPRADPRSPRLARALQRGGSASGAGSQQATVTGRRGCQACAQPSAPAAAQEPGPQPSRVLGWGWGAPAAGHTRGLSPKQPPSSLPPACLPARGALPTEAGRPRGGLCRLAGGFVGKHPRCARRSDTEEDWTLFRAQGVTGGRDSSQEARVS